MELNEKDKDKPTAISDTVLRDQVDCINRSLANLRPDIAAIVRETILQVMKELEATEICGGWL